MATMLPTADGWEQVKRPPSLFRRYQFDSYRATRAFLDRLAVLSEETGQYPDLGFSTTYVNVTVHTSGESPTDADVDFAKRVAALALLDPATI